LQEVPARFATHARSQTREAGASSLTSWTVTPFLAT
jgi:hypothetical protein